MLNSTLEYTNTTLLAESSFLLGDSIVSYCVWSYLMLLILPHSCPSTLKDMALRFHDRCGRIVKVKDRGLTVEKTDYGLVALSLDSQN